MNELIQAILDAVYGGMLGNAAYDVVKPIFQQTFPGKQAPLHDRQALLDWLRQELGNDLALAQQLQREISTAINEAKVKGDHNTLLQGISHSNVTIVHGGASQSLISNQSPATRYLTPYERIPEQDKPLGRAEELKELRHLLWEKGSLAVVKGLGGIGKTTLARFYVDSYGHEYRHIVWVKVANGLAEGFSQNTHLHDRLGLDLTHITTAQDRFRACIATLELADGPNLLVLDNAIEDAAAAEWRSLLPKSPKWQVLLTSRLVLHGYTRLDLDRLPEPAARELFERCYGKPVDAADWQALCALTHGHTLSLELFGKSLHNSLGQRKPADLIHCLKTHQLDDALLQQLVDTSHSEGDATVYQHLLATFGFVGFGDYELWLFKQFVALPLMPFGIMDLKKWLQVPEADVPALTAALLQMEKSGWLQRDGDAFSMHPMTQQAAYYRLHPTDKDVADLVESVIAILHWDQSTDNVVDKFPLIPFGEALLDNIAWEDHAQKSELQNHLAGIYWQMANYHKSVDFFETALVSNLESFGEKHPNVAKSRNNLAHAYRALGKHGKARDLLELALASGLESFGEKHPIVATRQSNLANVYSDLGEHGKARDLLEQALASDLESFGEKHPNVATHRSNLANVYSALGEHGKARDLLEQALASDLESFGEKHPNVATHRSNLANVYGDLGEHGKARDLLEQALASDLESFGEKHPNVAARQSNLANVYGDLGEHNKARDLLEQALASDLESFGEKHPNVATDYNNLAWIYRNQRQWLEAEGLYQKAINIYLETLGEDHPHTKVAKRSLAFVQTQLAKKPTDIYCKTLEEDHPHTKVVKQSLAFVQTHFAKKTTLTLWQRIKAFFQP